MFVMSIETIGDRLARLVAVAGLGLEELDRLAGLSPGHSGQVVRGHKSKLRVATAIAIASVFGVSAEYLANGTGQSPATLSVRRAVTKARFAHAAKVAAMPAKTKRLGRSPGTEEGRRAASNRAKKALAAAQEEP